MDHATKRATYTGKVVEDIHDEYRLLVKGWLHWLMVSFNLPPFLMVPGRGVPLPAQPISYEEDFSEVSSTLPTTLLRPTTLSGVNPSTFSSSSRNTVFKRDPLSPPPSPYFLIIVIFVLLMFLITLLLLPSGLCSYDGG